jgi:hypothetical protein
MPLWERATPRSSHRPHRLRANVVCAVCTLSRAALPVHLRLLWPLPRVMGEVLPTAALHAALQNTKRQVTGVKNSLSETKPYIEVAVAMEQQRDPKAVRGPVRHLWEWRRFHCRACILSTGALFADSKARHRCRLEGVHACGGWARIARGSPQRALDTPLLPYHRQRKEPATTRNLTASASVARNRAVQLHIPPRGHTLLVWASFDTEGPVKEGAWLSSGPRTHLSVLSTLLFKLLLSQLLHTQQGNTYGPRPPSRGTPHLLISFRGSTSERDGAGRGAGGGGARGSQRALRDDASTGPTHRRPHTTRGHVRVPPPEPRLAPVLPAPARTASAVTTSTLGRTSMRGAGKGNGGHQLDLYAWPFPREGRCLVWLGTRRVHTPGLVTPAVRQLHELTHRCPIGLSRGVHAERTRGASRRAQTSPRSSRTVATLPRCRKRRCGRPWRSSRRRCGTCITPAR